MYFCNYNSQAEYLFIGYFLQESNDKKEIQNDHKETENTYKDLLISNVLQLGGILVRLFLTDFLR